MNGSSFKIIFRLSIIHTYFEDNAAKEMTLDPGSKTQNLFERFNFKWARNEGTFSLYANTQSTIEEFLNYITTSSDINCFDFEIIPTGSNFYGYTKMPITNIERFLYNSNSVHYTQDKKFVQLQPIQSEEEGSRVFARVEIRFEDILSNLLPVPRYEIKFEARETQWNYYIINKNAIDLSNSIIDSREKIVFTEPEELQLENGQHALWFSSGDTLLPLSEVPKYKFNLINKPKNGSINKVGRLRSKTIFLGLPNPDPKQIEITKLNGKKQVSSPMYVYV